MKRFRKISPHYFGYGLLFLLVIFSIIKIVLAAAPNPGHNFTEVSGGIATGQLIYGSATDTFSALSDVAAGSPLISGGVGIAPAYAAYLFSGTSAQTYTFPTTSKTVAANDGSNLTIASQAIGDVLTATSTTAYGRLADVASGSPLISGGVGIAPAYAAYLFSGTSAQTYTFPSTSKTVAANDGSNLTIASQAIGDLLTASSTTAYGRLADVAAGSYLRSGGAGAAPVWSTPTLPNTATNRKILVGNATNWVESTETYAVPGSAGNVLASDGTNWISSPRAGVFNQSVSTPGAGFASDTYLVGSSTAIPATGLKAGTRYHLIFNVSKTAAGTATPILNIRFGTAGSTADTSRCAMTWTAGTAAIDDGIFQVWATFRTIGSGTSAVIQCVGEVTHRLTTTGLINAGATARITTTGGGFDSTVANSIIGTSVNGGTSAAWTITLVQAELTNLP